MVERIRTLLETRQLTPTQFADLIGVARPIVSHVLSGRNKPSLEVVQRILSALPELSMSWLLNGTGTIYAGTSATVDSPKGNQETMAAPAAAITPVTAPIEVPPKPTLALEPALPPSPRNMRVGNSLPANNRRASGTSKGYPTPKRFAPEPVETPRKLVEAPVTPILRASVPVMETVPFPTQILPESQASSLPIPDAADALSGNDGPMAAALFAGAEKPIRRIVIFYRDGSFADYQPE